MQDKENKIKRLKYRKRPGPLGITICDPCQKGDHRRCHNAARDKGGTCICTH